MMSSLSCAYSVQNKVLRYAANFAKVEEKAAQFCQGYFTFLRVGNKS